MAKKFKDEKTGSLFLDDLPSAEEVEEIALRPLKHPIWSNHKARLIEKYLYFFVLITKHGTYIDGFAGPQSPEHLDTWSAKRVVESRPRYLRNIFLCEIDSEKIELLDQMIKSQPAREKKEAKRNYFLLFGDFNEKIDFILNSGTINEKEAAFALLDQRTFECHWETVRKIAFHKRSGNKIELFYFLAVKWLHRSLAGIVANEKKVEFWWGKKDWNTLKNLSQSQIRDVVAKRIKDELGYKYSVPFPIYEKEEGEGSIMYYMIHASDHPDAPRLMWRAYNQAIMPLEAPEQGVLDLR